MNLDMEATGLAEYEDFFKLGHQAESAKRQLEELTKAEEDARWLEEYKNKETERFMSFVHTTHREGTPTKSELTLYYRDFRLQEERASKPNAAMLPCQKEAPYAIWTAPSDGLANGLFESMGLFTGGDSTDFEDPGTLLALQASIPENSTKAYRGDIRYIGAWLAVMGYNFWEPLTEQWLERFVVDHLEGFKSKKAQEAELILLREKFKSKAGPHAYSTVVRRLAALSNYCKSKGWENPVRSERVRFLLRQLGKHYASSSQPTAITRNHLINILDQAGNDLVGLRDKALLAFIFASGGRRRVEAEEALIEDLEDLGDSYLFHMRRSKTNKSGKSEPKPVTGMAADLLGAWIEALGESTGPLFRPINKAGLIKPIPLKGVFISRIVKKLAAKAGYNPKDFSAHSLRSGFVSQAAREGCSMPEVKALTGHRTDAMVSRYYQQGDVLRSKAGNLL